MKLEIITKNADETIDLAAKFAKSLLLPTCIVLSGDLGAGKTTFTKGLAKGLKINNIVTSPTFTILNEYGDDIILRHFDMYRLKSVDEAYELGFDEYFLHPSKNTLTVVEWAENVEGLIPKSAIKVEFEKLNENQRKICISGEK